MKYILIFITLLLISCGQSNLGCKKMIVKILSCKADGTLKCTVEYMDSSYGIQYYPIVGSVVDTCDLNVKGMNP